jgi:hypothetical protein
MKLIDANAINDILKNGITLTENYYLAPDVVDEVELTTLSYNKPLPSEVQPLENLGVFDMKIYLSSYKQMLNSQGGRSFFNMTGLGDISILASIDMLLKVFTIQKTERLFDPTEPILVYTRDKGLKKRIQKEFDGKEVTVKPVDQLQ